MKELPKPGKPVRGSQTGRPIMVLLDLLGRRWSLRVLWELRESSLTFRALRKNCDNVSPTVLNKRLKEFQEAHLLELVPGQGYTLTEQGKSLLVQLAPLNEWSKEWAKSFPEE